MTRASARPNSPVHALHIRSYLGHGARYLLPLEAGIAEAVELTLALKHARALLQVLDLVSQAMALPRYTSP